MATRNRDGTRRLRGMIDFVKQLVINASGAVDRYLRSDGAHLGKPEELEVSPSNEVVIGLVV